jgi:hypothetical protein
MQNGGGTQTGTASKELRFDCPHCSAPMYVAAGSTIKSLDCKRCKKSVRIPRTVLPPTTQGTVLPRATSKKPAPVIASTVAAARTSQDGAASRATTSTVDAPTPNDSIVLPPTPAPPPTPLSAAPPSTNLSLDELKRQLKENQSQRTEVTGHINQLNIQLHRWQLRMNTLNERQRALEAQIGDSHKGA